MVKQYPNHKSPKHATIRLPKYLVNAIQDFLKTDIAKKKGFLHITDVATEAVRDLLETEGYYPNKPTLEHFNLTETGVTVLDRSLQPPKGMLINVHFKPDARNRLQTWCEYDESEDCVHVKFALELPEVQGILNKKAWKAP